MKLHLTLTALPFLLLACATPQQRCIRLASDEISTVARLISETQANLARGYRIEHRTEQSFELQFCARPNSRFVWCNRPVTRSVAEEVAIDPVAEQRKLASLQARRQVLEQQYGKDVAACENRFPEQG